MDIAVLPLPSGSVDRRGSGSVARPSAGCFGSPVLVGWSILISGLGFVSVAVTISGFTRGVSPVPGLGPNPSWGEAMGRDPDCVCPRQGFIVFGRGRVVGPVSWW